MDQTMAHLAGAVSRRTTALVRLLLEVWRDHRLEATHRSGRCRSTGFLRPG